MSPSVFMLVVVLAPVCLLAGVATGATITHRLMRGLPPMPAMPTRRPKLVHEPEPPKGVPLPKVKL